MINTGNWLGKRPQTIETTMGGSYEDDRFTLCICPKMKDGPTVSINELSLKDLITIRDNIECILQGP